MNRNKTKILIIDSNLQNIHVLKGILKEEGFESDFSKKETEAFEILEKSKIDLIILDSASSELNGIEVCRKIKSKWSSIPVILLASRTETAVSGLEAGAQDFVIKPFLPEELKIRVKTQTDLKQKTDQLNESNRKLKKAVEDKTKQLVEANNNLMKLDKAKSSFISLISHELRTPLNGLTMITEEFKTSLTNPLHQEYNEILISITEQLTKFMEMALLITDVKSKTYKRKIHFVSLKQAAEEAVKNLDEKIEEKSVNIEIDDRTDDLKIMGDYNLIYKCILFILENGIKFSPKKGNLEILIDSNDSEIYIEIIDEGPGFPKEAMDSLFEFFSAFDILHHNQGLGLSLATAKLIMDMQMGEIEIKNRDAGGASVKLSFFKNFF